VLVCRPGEDLPTGRVIVVVGRDDLRPVERRGTALAFEVASRLARQAEATRLVVTDLDPRRVRGELDGFRVPGDVGIVGVADLPTRLMEVLEPGDVIVTAVPPTPAGIRRDATRLARAVPSHTVVVVVPR